MSKFNNPGRAAVALPQPPRFQWTQPQPVQPPAPRPSTGVVSPADASPMVSVGFRLFLTLLLAGYLNDWSFRLLGGKAYLSTIAVVLVPLAWLASGQALAGFKRSTGIWWLSFLLLLMMGVPFSYWKSGSVEVISNYATRSLSLFFYIVSFTTTLKRCRTLMKVNLICAGIVLLTCAAFGSFTNDGRFQIGDSIFFSNANELGLQLVLGMALFCFMFYSGVKWQIALGAGGFLLSFVYLVKTGSRGCLLASILLVLVIFYTTKKKALMAIVLVPAVAIGLALSPASSLRRLALIFQPAASAMTDDERSAVESSLERQELFRKGLMYTLTHPLLGVGAGQFPVAVFGDAAKQGQHASFLGTHNSYVQVSAECGIPAFICYMAVIVISLRRSYSLYSVTRGRPEYSDVEGLAFTLMAGVVVYSFATFFFHMAYTGLLPLLSGQVLALSNATAGQIQPRRR